MEPFEHLLLSCPQWRRNAGTFWAHPCGMPKHWTKKWPLVDDQVQASCANHMHAHTGLYHCRWPQPCHAACLAVLVHCGYSDSKNVPLQPSVSANPWPWPWPMTLTFNTICIQKLKLEGQPIQKLKVDTNGWMNECYYLLYLPIWPDKDLKNGVGNGVLCLFGTCHLI